MNNTDKQYDWESIELDYRLGSLTLDDISRMHDAPVDEIKAMAMLENWGAHDETADYLRSYRYRLFVEEYLVAFDKGAAMKAAGYNPSSSVNLLNRPEVRAMTEIRLRQKAAQATVNRDRIIEEYAKIAFFDPADLFDEEGKPIPVNKMKPETRAAIAGLDVVEGNGVLLTKKYKLADKKSALDSLGKHLGMFTDKVDVKAEVGVTATESDTNDAARRIAFILAQAMKSKKEE